MATPGSMFISYRRSDSSTESGRIYDKLVEIFGRDRVFKDVYAIPPGYDFVSYLENAVAQCDVLMALMGPTWLTVRDAQGDRRLDDPNDFVRIEIASALRGTRTLVIPVLLNGAMMPSVHDLPADLHALTRRNAAAVRQDPDFHPDMARLITGLHDYFASQGLAAPDPSVTSAGTPPLPVPSTAAANPEVHRGDSISATLSGQMSGNIAVGKHITQTQQVAAAPTVTEGDRQQLQQLLDTLVTQISHDVPTDQKTAALERLEDLQDSLLGAEPDLATVEYVVKWFKKKAPQSAMYVTGTLQNPLVERVLVAAGAIAPGELRPCLDR